jgi:hypothetical protein
VIINDGPHSANGSTEWVSRFPNRGVSSTTKMKNSKMEIRDLVLKLVLIFTFFHYYVLGLFHVRKKRKMGVITSLDESDQEQPTEYKTFFYLSDGLIYSKWCFRFKSSFMCDLS